MHRGIQNYSVGVKTPLSKFDQCIIKTQSAHQLANAKTNILLGHRLLTVWTSPAVSCTFTGMTLHRDKRTNTTCFASNLTNFVLIKAP